MTQRLSDTTTGELVNKYYRLMNENKSPTKKMVYELFFRGRDEVYQHDDIVWEDVVKHYNLYASKPKRNTKARQRRQRLHEELKEKMRSRMEE